MPSGQRDLHAPSPTGGAHFFEELPVADVNELFSALLEIQRPRQFEGRSIDVDWVFRGQPSAAWRLVPKSRRCPRPGDVEPLRCVINRIIERESQLHRWDSLTRSVLQRHPEQLVTDEERRCLQDVASDYHRIRCEAECEAVYQFARQADDIGLVLLDHVEDIAGTASSETFMARLMLPSRTTALAQHHEIATKLLDWSKRFKVAAYFAALRTEGLADDDTEQMAVWALDASALDPARSSASRELPLVRTFTCPHAAHGFLHAQDGMFTWCDETFQGRWLAREGRWPTLLDALAHEGFYRGEPKQIVLYKFVLSRKFAWELRRRLRVDRISLASMMPSYDNVARSVREQWQDDEQNSTVPSPSE